MNKIYASFIAILVIGFSLSALMIPFKACAGETFSATLTLPLDLSKAKERGTISFTITHEDSRDYYTIIDQSVSNATTNNSTSTNNNNSVRNTTTNNSTTNNNTTNNTTNNSTQTHINQNHNNGIIIN